MHTRALELRACNQALEYLVANYQERDGKVSPLVAAALPRVALELYSESTSVAETLAPVLVDGIAPRFIRWFTGTDKNTMVVFCVYDLMLSTCFSELLEFFGDKEIASLFVDSLVFQATGCEASSPSDSDLRDRGTQKARGIHKYVLGRQVFGHIGDTEAWIFGKEMASLKGNAKDIAYILPMAPTSIAVRLKAKSIIHKYTDGKIPSEAEAKATSDVLHKQNEELLKKIREHA